jgi:serine/threonine-protein kinase
VRYNVYRAPTRSLKAGSFVRDRSSQELTKTGMAVGTPLDMSPEQAVGEQVGPPSDIYSLACIRDH